MTATSYVHALWEKAFHCMSIYDETRVNRLFVDGQHEHVRSSVQTWWRSHRNADLHTIAANATAAAYLGGGSKIKGSNSDGYSAEKRPVLLTGFGPLFPPSNPP